MEQETIQKEEEQKKEVIIDSEQIGNYTFTIYKKVRTWAKPGEPVFYYVLEENSPRFKYPKTQNLGCKLTEEQASHIISQLVKERREVLEYKQERKNKAKLSQIEFKESLQVGSIVYTSWGYEQTNVEFYQITKKTGDMVELQEIAQDRKEIGFMCGVCVPIPNHFITSKHEDEPVKRRKIGNGYIKINSCVNAWLWTPERGGLHYSYYA